VAAARAADRYLQHTPPLPPDRPRLLDRTRGLPIASGWATRSRW
jgi:hypothetical protein